MSSFPISTKFGWSFCIPTAPGGEGQLSLVISSIISEFADRSDFEIIIIGNCSVSKIESLQAPKNLQYVHFLPFKEEHFSFNWKHLRRAVIKGRFRDAWMRGAWITRKKNLLVQHAYFDNICLMHDYVALEAGWREGFKRYGFDWEVCVNAVLNKNQTRHRDWLVWDYPEIGAALLPYEVNDLSRFMYISGTYFCVKKFFFLDHPLDERLHWGESEDIEWSIRVRNYTNFRFNPYSQVIYTKEKSLDEAPYCDEWRIRGLLLNKKLGVA